MAMILDNFNKPIREPVWFSLGWARGGSLDVRLGRDVEQRGGSRVRAEYGDFGVRDHSFFGSFLGD